MFAKTATQTPDYDFRAGAWDPICKTWRNLGITQNPNQPYAAYTTYCKHCDHAFDANIIDTDDATYAELTNPEYARQLTGTP